MLQRCRPCLLRALALAARDSLLAGKFHSGFSQPEAAPMTFQAPQWGRSTAFTFAGVTTAGLQVGSLFTPCFPTGSSAREVSALVCGAHLAPTSRAVSVAASWPAHVHARAPDALQRLAWQRQGLRAFASAPAAAEAPADAATGGSSAEAPVQLTDTAVQVRAVLHLELWCASAFFFTCALQHLLVLDSSARRRAATEGVVVEHLDLSHQNYRLRGSGRGSGSCSQMLPSRTRRCCG